MEPKLLHPISFNPRIPYPVTILLAGFATFIISFIYFLNLDSDFVYKIQRQAVVQKIENYEYSLREKAATQAVHTEAVSYQLPSDFAVLPSAKWVPQTFNNCGPATTSMVLQYFGYSVSQEDTKSALRTNPDDKNVFTFEISDYLRKNYNIESKLLYNGSAQTLKTLIANGIYVMVEDWLHPNEDIGHVTILRGFDDKRGMFIADDSYLGTNIKYPYEEFDKTQWKPFNREYLPVYKPEQKALVETIVGNDWDEKTMFENAVEKNLADTKKDSEDMYAWFNVGTSYFALGKFQEAKSAFEKSKEIGWPKRMLWYQIQPVETYIALSESDKAIQLANVGLIGNDSFSELHLEKAKAYKGLGDMGKAREETEKALYYHPNYPDAKEFLNSL
ncbi:hypothetical protein A2962_01325 [Candidatus Woesebacteria bacterium RIFCSPLOWO2_01_FULL_39_61]|uniref:Peptidase C39-like domain-containing protein n=1 Tax=Candidatus Woesebacteria bacterium RIFCSPHIGHO2_02_FULL_39_13 TaxID=1802505 RepID=A0A1F7Z4D7_9BACT|nr:MAG: hypothetical protein A2692_01565 [Candidatus Woesebacteria bacterium RIFCSPHIGHO2_01_FULL_39_95]OGM34492.1 MAG: hypothetical protein A3D01_03020 [Candidatus Woesebacteria bacterium RIFCSPHIGHO2_02_FULL_39_13]OGM38757.1 MAG: hypothetical protein A3E13_00910 [Candidatus Woesebacteria bacterium RIFCSPHIGHO2_12_FULL_40_20]OGM65763.1 MAG: hypothetical protein A2962_01325 [Candidatus Woesebacteria bacterium RIFCSPLOWO2_01_FULL_39_61]OGM71510.1 MAG: hypothetical protein A3H19_00120 [Candidatus